MFSNRPYIETVACFSEYLALMEAISNEMVALGFNVINARQMTANHSLPHRGNQIIILHLLPNMIKRSEKLQEIFKLSGLSHVVTKAEVQRAHDSLTQYYNCQSFGNVWTICKRMYIEMTEAKAFRTYIYVYTIVVRPYTFKSYGYVSCMGLDAVTDEWTDWLTISRKESRTWTKN
jgi:hypothetical protein